MKRLSLYTTIFVSLVIVITYILKWPLNDIYVNKSQFKFAIPKPPTLVIKLPDKDYIGNCEAWGLNSNFNPPVLPSNNPISNLNQNTGGYFYKEISGVPAIVSKTDASYRWEFYGTLTKNHQTLAIFYNPQINKSKLVSVKDQLDKDLIITKIAPDAVQIQYKNHLFKLKVFNFKGAKK